MELHFIADDLDNHAWYEELFSRMIGDAEAYVAGWAACDEVVSAPEDEDPASQ